MDTLEDILENTAYGLIVHRPFDISRQVVAHVSLVIIRYNLFSSIKRSLDYETIGGLFNDVYEGVHELTVVEKIWDIIIEVIAVVAELTGADVDVDELILQIIENNRRLAALRAYAIILYVKLAFSSLTHHCNAERSERASAPFAPE